MTDLTLGKNLICLRFPLGEWLGETRMSDHRGHRPADANTGASLPSPLPEGEASPGLCALFAGVFGIVALGSVLLFTSRFGAGFSPDSVGYIQLARHLSGSAEASSLAREPIAVQQPPLFPVVLWAVERWMGMDPLVSVRYVNAILFAVILLLSAALFRQNLKVCGYLCYVGIILVLIGPVLDVSTMAWTEPLFIVWTLSFLLLLDRYRRSQRVRDLLLCAVVVVLAFLTRYIGVTLIGAGLLLIPVLTRPDLRRRLTCSVVFVGMTTGVVVLYAARNLYCSGTPFGTRYRSVFTLGDNIAYTIQIMLPWFLKPRLADHPAAAIAASAIIGVAVVMGGRRVLSRLRDGTLAWRDHPWLPALTFASIYTTFLIVTSTTTAYDQINDRLLAPVYAPVVLLVLWLAQRATSLLRAHLSRSTFTMVALIWTWVLLIGPMHQLAPEAKGWLKRGRGGYGTVRWHDSKLMSYLAQDGLPDAGRPVYSNKPDAVYILLGREIQRSPQKLKIHNSAEVACELSNLSRQHAELEGAYLVWFNCRKSPAMFSREELASAFALDEIRTFPDGEVYLVGRARPSPVSGDRRRVQLVHAEP